VAGQSRTNESQTVSNQAAGEFRPCGPSKAMKWYPVSRAFDAMLEQIRSNDSWNYYQAKGIKSSILETRTSVLEALGKPVDPEV